jgi:hypothetical protein
MKKFESYGQVGYAYSEMPCGEKEYDHRPHVWDSQHAVYGPYWCPGVNPTWEFKNGSVVRSVSSDMGYVKYNNKWYKMTESVTTDEKMNQHIEDGFAEKVL